MVYKCWHNDWPPTMATAQNKQQEKYTIGPMCQPRELGQSTNCESRRTQSRGQNIQTPPQGLPQGRQSTDASDDCVSVDTALGTCASVGKRSFAYRQLRPGPEAGRSDTTPPRHSCTNVLGWRAEADWETP